jgi:hypothetical protein
MLDDAAAAMVADGFNPPAPADALAAPVVARLNAGSVYPLRLFLEWVDRCPELRAILLAQGVGWGVGDEAVVAATPDPSAGGKLPPGAFWADFGGGYVVARLTDPPRRHGAMIQAQEVFPRPPMAGQDKPQTRRIRFIALAAVRDDCRADVDARTANLPGAREQLSFESELAPGEGGRPLPPPDFPIPPVG